MKSTKFNPKKKIFIFKERQKKNLFNEINDEIKIILKYLKIQLKCNEKKNKS